MDKIPGGGYTVSTVFLFMYIQGRLPGWFCGGAWGQEVWFYERWFLCEVLEAVRDSGAGVVSDEFFADAGD